MDTIRQEWFSNVRNDVLAGLVVALALIPEAIAFSIIAGVMAIARRIDNSSSKSCLLIIH